MSIPDTILVAVCPFGPDLSAALAAETIARGILAAGRPEPDLCPLEDDLGGSCGGALGAALKAIRFDKRLRNARAVIVGAGRLSRETLPGSPLFEVATRARQAGVPAYAVTARNELDPFDARMLDLQVVLEVSPRRLTTAGRRLAEIA